MGRTGVGTCGLHVGGGPREGALRVIAVGGQNNGYAVIKEGAREVLALDAIVSQ